MTKIQKLANSLIEIEEVHESLQKTEYSLPQLLKGVSPKDVDIETDWGSQEGEEVW